MVPSSSANFTRAIFPRCVFSWRNKRMRVMADRASSKQIFEVSNAPSNKRKKSSPNLFCSSGHSTMNFPKVRIAEVSSGFEEARSAITLIRCFLHENTQRRKIARVKFAEELGTMSKNSLRWIPPVRGPIWEIHSLTLMISCCCSKSQQLCFSINYYIVFYRD